MSENSKYNDVSPERLADLLRQYVEYDLEAAEPDYVRQVLFDILGMTKNEAGYVGLDWLWPEDRR